MTKKDEREVEAMPQEIDAKATPQKGVRTCVGCGQPEDREAFVRLVLADGTVVVDAAGGAFGRGVHVHPRPKCVELAVKGGLARAFRANVKMTSAELAADIANAFARRASGLLSSARRAKKVALGADATVEALDASPDTVVVVATDAAHAAGLGPVQRAVAEGRAAAWLDRAALGAIFGRSEVAVCAISDERIGHELVHACNVRASMDWVGENSRGEACRSREVR